MKSHRDDDNDDHNDDHVDDDNDDNDDNDDAKDDYSLQGDRRQMPCDSFKGRQLGRKVQTIMMMMVMMVMMMMMIMMMMAMMIMIENFEKVRLTYEVKDKDVDDNQK